MTSLDALYDRLPVVPCKGLCGREVCLEAVPCNPEELARIVTATGGRLPAAPHPARCSLLADDGRCTAYEVRPLVCRLFGAQPAEIAAWRCPHGCRAPVEPTERELARLMGEFGYFAGGAARSTNADLNRILDETGAVGWVFQGNDLVLHIEGEEQGEDHGEDEGEEP